MESEGSLRPTALWGGLLRAKVKMDKCATSGTY